MERTGQHGPALASDMSLHVTFSIPNEVFVIYSKPGAGIPAPSSYRADQTAVASAQADPR
jgi:hypothetical protein